MPHEEPDGERFEKWLAALDQRHLAELTVSEIARALRALSSCYVERRTRLSQGGALGTAGKRAAFALFYAPLHFLIVRHVVRALGLERQRVARVLDLGCGTGSAGAAWALDANAAVSGIDRHPWAVAEANWSYSQLGIAGRAVRLDLGRARITASPETGILAAYAINELPEELRAELLPRLLAAATRGAQVLVVEPISRRLTPWWPAWEAAFGAVGGVALEWRIDTRLPRRQHDLARAAGLDPRVLTARSLSLQRRTD
jgi:hypothetical protein